MKITSVNSILQSIFNNPYTSKCKISTFQDNRYSNHLFGISLYIPEGWSILDDKALDIELKKNIYQGDFDILKNSISSFYELPLAAFTKFDQNSPLYSEVVSPTIALYIVPKDSDIATMDLYEYSSSLESEHYLGYKLLKNFVVLDYGDLYFTSKYEVIKIQSSYQLVHRDLPKDVDVEMDLYYIDYEDFFLEVHMTHCKAQNQIATYEFEKVIKSLSLA